MEAKELKKPVEDLIVEIAKRAKDEKEPCLLMHRTQSLVNAANALHVLENIDYSRSVRS
jgi:hypothetical protein